MASMTRDAAGRVTVQFVHPIDRKRRSIRAGKMSQRDGEALKLKIEALVAGIASGLTLDKETQEWLTRISSDLREKLAAVRLIPRREDQVSRLGDFLDSYIAKKTDVDPATITNLKIGAARLVKYFGRDRELRSIKTGDCDDWVLWLKERYAEATVGKSVRLAKQFFRGAFRKELIARNPFEEVKAPSMANEARKRFIDRPTSTEVINACPSAEWRLIFALSRYGGLRCPSEHLALEWADLDWARERFLVRSPKTGNRWVPIFPELRPYFEEAFEAAPEGAVHVILGYRDAAQNLRTQLLRILRRAVVSPWPRLFHNLRASRETELAAEYPLHVVCDWIGNTERIAAKHYLQVTEEDFKKATSSAAKSGAAPVKKALQNPVQQDAVLVRTGSQIGSKSLKDCEMVRDDTTGRKCLQDNEVVPGGLEPPIFSTSGSCPGR